MAFFFNKYEALPFGIELKNVGYAIAGEIIGTFFLAFLYLTQTEQKTKLSKDPAITTLIISAAYVASLLMVSGPENYLACLNPAVAFGASFQQIYSGKSDGISVIYVYALAPLAGGLVAVFFHEFVYKKVQETIHESEEVDGILDNN